MGYPDGAGNAALASTVTTELDNWRCAGVEVQVFAAAREEITMAITITHKAGSDTSAIEAGERIHVGHYSVAHTCLDGRFRDIGHRGRCARRGRGPH